MPLIPLSSPLYTHFHIYLFLCSWGYQILIKLGHILKVRSYTKAIIIPLST